MCKKLDELFSLFFNKKEEKPIKTEVEETVTVETEIPPEIEQPEITEIEMKNVVICLDNGHGEETPGKRSPWSACKVKPELPFREYAYTRELVRMLTPLLEEDGFEVYIVAPEKYDVTLAERCKRINNKVKEAKEKGKHTLMVSVHNNAAGNGKEWKEAYGWSVWTTRGQNNSDILAQCLYDAAVEILTPLGQKTRKDRSDGDDDYEAGFYITKGSNCPAVLVENMFQDCIKEVQWMLTDEGKHALVEIHRRGINNFVKQMNW
jgi:N-acetylmuramoyl-L-alanine amidase